MAGLSGHSGGARAGAGRPPSPRRDSPTFKTMEAACSDESRQRIVEKITAMAEEGDLKAAALVLNYTYVEPSPRFLVPELPECFYDDVEMLWQTAVRYYHEKGDCAATRHLLEMDLPWTKGISKYSWDVPRTLSEARDLPIPHSPPPEEKSTGIPNRKKSGKKSGQDSVSTDETDRRDGESHHSVPSSDANVATSAALAAPEPTAPTPTVTTSDEPVPLKPGGEIIAPPPTTTENETPPPTSPSDDHSAPSEPPQDTNDAAALIIAELKQHDPRIFSHDNYPHLTRRQVLTLNQSPRDRERQLARNIMARDYPDLL